MTTQIFFKARYLANHGPNRVGDERFFTNEATAQDLARRRIVELLGTEERTLGGNPDDAYPDDLKAFLQGKVSHPSQAPNPSPKMSSRRGG